MIKVIFKNEGISLLVEKNTNLVDVIRTSGLYIETPCNGNGSCGKCIVRARGNLSTLKHKDITNEYQEILACITKVHGDAEIEILNNNTGLETKNLIINNNINLDKYEELGIALDIGSTGISAYLVDVDTGRVINRKSSLNPQVQYGSDVLSRISYSINNLKGKDTLKKVVILKLNEIILKLVKDKKNINKIYKVSISANTIMLHMLLGLDTYEISRAPYKPKFLDEKKLNPKELGIKINEEGIITILPSISAYLGADILSGALASGFHHKEYNSIFIDIGTNGEILARSNNEIIGTSTAAGPAFEGMNISCGCRVESGAIDTFKIIDEEIKFTTINNKEVQGICGSGLIDIISELVKKNVILKSGRFNSKLKGKLALKIKNKKFYITENIYLSQKDIREVQLAKAAISAGMILLLREVDLNIKDIKEIIIAGAFGYYLNSENIKIIGLIPKGFIGDINFVGNSSIEGSRLSLVNNDFIKEMVKLKGEIRILDISLETEFQDCFIREMSF